LISIDPEIDWADVYKILDKEIPILPEEILKKP
jgi:hypothetical protein